MQCVLGLPHITRPQSSAGFLWVILHDYDALVVSTTLMERVGPSWDQIQWELPPSMWWIERLRAEQHTTSLRW